MKPALLLSFATLLAAASCGNDHATPSHAHAGSGSQAGEGGDPPLEPTQFGRSDCRACVADACAVPEADCNSEPACARYLSCLDACPTAESGGVEAGCAGRCDLPSSSSLAILAGAVTSCRARGFGLDCPCGNERPPEGVDLLNQMCSPSTDENPCFKCEEEQCCESYAACHENAECQAFMDCVKACPSAGLQRCEVDCNAEHPQGTELGLQRISCILALCQDPGECQDEELDPCVKCVQQRCAAEDVACQTDFGCVQVYACAHDCDVTDAACYTGCNALDEQGAVLFQTAYGDCPVAQCAAECG